MKAQKLFRLVHHWGSIVIAPPLVIMIGAGLLLMLKKDVDWIQPPTQRGTTSELPSQTFNTLFEAARAVPEAGITTWADLDRVDIKPDKGVVKFVSASRWEVQVDTTTAEVLQVAYRRSDLIEGLHDGSFFADWVKLGIFLPAGVVLFVLWLTGLYLFFLPYIRKARKKPRRASSTSPETGSNTDMRNVPAE